MSGPRLRAASPLSRVAGLLGVALATVAALAFATELAAGALFRESKTSTMQCLVVTDAVTGTRGIPGSRCVQKAPESPPVAYAFDACGFRSATGCARKRPGTFRVVLIGSSTVFGMHVAQADAFATLLPRLLSQRLGRPVEVVNQGLQWGLPSALVLRTDAMLRADPDLILWMPTPLDIHHAAGITPFVPGVQLGALRPGPLTEIAGGPPPGAGAGGNPLLTRLMLRWQRLIDALGETRTAYLLKHLLYRSDSQFLDHALMGGAQSDYLRPGLTRQWRAGLAIFGEDLRGIVAAARARSVPVAVMPVPSREQLILLTGAPRADADARALGKAMRPIVEANGATYVDSLAHLRPTGSTGGLFYPIDQHMSPEGHRWMTSLLADRLADARAGTIAGVRVGGR